MTRLSIKKLLPDLFVSNISDLPMVSKLRRLQIFSSGVTLLIAFILASTVEIINERNRLILEIETTAKMIGFNAEAALLFNDARSADTILAALRNKKEIIGAQIFTKDGEPFARSTEHQNL
ncbi:MAG: hypothetical protein Kow0065_20110 [Methylomicrobium sp.]